LYKDKPYQKEAEFIHGKIQKHNSKNEQTILELACGTGTHSGHLATFGYSITATDRSKESLEIARQKSSTKDVKFKVMDMESPENLGRFDVVICLFDSIGYLIDNKKISALFDFVRASLKPGGIFIYEYWHAGAFLKSHDVTRYKFIEKLNLHRVSNTSIDYSNQFASVNYKFFQDGNFYEETHNNRFFLAQEMNLFIEKAGFELCERYAGYSDVENIDENTWHILDIIKSK
ncbi:MAG TPA: class I SAM-dependent methyltransferase, partial [Flavisolibacter sp.]|nr:class I SAM-dependent methyltransferase [Flavisolibacter sp.]